MKILVKGGADFIGSAHIRYLIQHIFHEVLNVDKFTYAVMHLAAKSHVDRSILAAVAFICL